MKLVNLTIGDLYMKTVNFPIKVPSGKYCWDFTNFNDNCEFFDNEGGHVSCELGFDIARKNYDADGVLKAEECNALKEIE